MRSRRGLWCGRGGMRPLPTPWQSPARRQPGMPTRAACRLSRIDGNRFVGGDSTRSSRHRATVRDSIRDSPAVMSILLPPPCNGSFVAPRHAPHRTASLSPAPRRLGAGKMGPHIPADSGSRHRQVCVLARPARPTRRRQATDARSIARLLGELPCRRWRFTSGTGTATADERHGSATGLRCRPGPRCGTDHDSFVSRSRSSRKRKRSPAQVSTAWLVIG